MRKFIKKILNLFTWLALVIVLLSFAISLAINIPAVQLRITNKAMEKVMQLFGSNISYADVRLRLFNRATFEEILITDQNNDTLVYAEKLSVKIPGILRKVLIDPEQPVRLSKLELENSYLRIAVDSSYTVNLKFIPDTIKANKKDTLNQSPFYMDQVKITNSRLDIHHFLDKSKGDCIDFSKLTFSEFNLDVRDLRAFKDTLSMQIAELNLIDKSGFVLTEFSSSLDIKSDQLHFDDVAFRTNSSELGMKKIHFDFNSFKDFGDNGIYSKVKIDIECHTGDLQLNDLAYFNPVFDGFVEKVDFSGRFFGYISNLNGREVKLKYGETTSLEGNLDIIGLPDGENTFLLASIDEFNTNTTDLNNFTLPNNKSINIPDRFKEITYMSYSGDFTGFFKDFVSYGTFNTNLGEGKLDLLFKPDTNNLIGFSGALSTSGFDLGPMVGSGELFGKISFNLDVEGRGHIDEDFKVILAGKVNAFEINDYNYQNLTVDGTFSENKFNGTLRVNDENLSMDFNGLLDFSSRIRHYDFTANVFNSNLYKLNINKFDPNYTASFLINANLFGNSIDSLNGEVKLLNSLFSNSDAQIQVYDLGLVLRNDSIENQLSLRSEFVDGDLSGKFQLSKLGTYYENLMNYYLPALDSNIITAEFDKNVDLNYSLNFKNSLPLFNYFVPEFSLAPYSYIEGELHRGNENYATLHAESPKMILKKTEVTELVFNAMAVDSVLNVDVGCVKLNLSKRITFNNLTVLADVDSNNIVFNSRWLNWDSTLHKGNIEGEAYIRDKIGGKLLADLSIDSSFLVISDSLWFIDPFLVSSDTNSIQINDFSLTHNDEFLKVSGLLSEDYSDSLSFDFNNFNFGNLNFFTRSSTFRFGGLLNGNAMVTGIKKPLFIANMFIDDLELNGELIGDTHLDSEWNNEEEAIDIQANVLRGRLKTIEVDGQYFPTRQGEMKMNLSFNKFRLDFINPYLNTVFSDIQGLATGFLTLTGKGKTPNLNGSLNLQKAALTVDYLQTRYNFTSEIDITNNNFVFDHVVLYDKFINTAVLNGIIRTKYLKDFELNLTLQPQEFFCLNTTFDDNKSFFGKAFATGLIRIQGPTQNLKFDINARTDPGTEFNIPLSDTEELSEYDFIKMVSADSTEKTSEEDEYKVNLSGLQLDFNLNVTPDANVKIIFDPTLGDEISTRGNGNLLIGINSLGDFNMHGEYVVESGEYLFTLKDLLINKKFKVEQGSSLQWTGDPVNATVDIQTYYRTKASLSDLTGSENNIRYVVDCQLGLSGRLKQPEINYNVYLPFAEQEERDQLEAKIHSNEEMGKQFLALLVLNRFIYASNDRGSGLDNSNIAGVNASELLSNQLSNWLSQISDEFDIGVNYRPGTELTPQEWEVALSTQLLDDRLSINGSVDMRTKAEASEVNNFLGNLVVDYKISRNGKVRARAYNRGNDNEMATYSKYTQGIGLFYTEEFDKLSEIGSWYKDDKKSKRKKKDRKGAKRDDKAVIREEDSQ